MWWRQVFICWLITIRNPNTIYIIFTYEMDKNKINLIDLKSSLGPGGSIFTDIYIHPTNRPEGS